MKTLNPNIIHSITLVKPILIQVCMPVWMNSFIICSLILFFIGVMEWTKYRKMYKDKLIYWIKRIKISRLMMIAWFSCIEICIHNKLMEVKVIYIRVVIIKRYYKKPSITLS